ncbi:hypothetical protein ACLOJK_025142 [Asimina triloba]
MAKKKLPKQESPTQSPPQENAKEQLASLKTLNNLLVRETVERREQIDSLQRSKDALETQLSQSLAKARDLEAQKSVSLDRIAASEVEQGIIVLVVASELGRREEEVKGKIADAQKIADSEAEAQRAMSQILKSMEREREELVARIAVSDAMAADSIRGKEETDLALAEKEAKIRELRKEIDCAREDLVMHKEELRRLRLSAEGLEKNNAEGRQKNKQLQIERDGLTEEKIEMGKRFEALMEDRDTVQRRLEELSQRFDDLKKELSDTVKAMDDVKRAWAAQDVEMSELRKEAGRLNVELQHGRDALDAVLHERNAARTEVVRQKDETERLVLKVLELEQSNAAIQEELRNLKAEQDVLVGEKEGRERALELLMMEKTSIDRSLKESLQCIQGLTCKIEEIEREKDEIEQDKASHKVEIAQLLEKVGCLNATVSALEQSSAELVEANRKLDVDLSDQKHAFEQLLVQKDGILKDLQRQKHGAESLKMEVSELGKINEKTQQELEQIRAERGRLLEEKEDAAQRFHLLADDRNLMEKHLSEAQQGFNDLQKRIELAETLSRRALSMLKDTARTVCDSGLDNGEKGRNVESIFTEEKYGNIQSFEARFEAIKRAFEMQSRLAKDAKAELKSLQVTVTELQKKKNFWTWFSSATTIVAAASVAFIAKGGH